MTLDRLFAVYDTVKEVVIMFKFYPTAASFIRDNSRMIYQTNSNFESETILYELGVITDDDKGRPVLTAHSDLVIHSWDEYKFPENPVNRVDVNQTSLKDVAH